MTPADLANRLGEMYRNAPTDDTMTMLHLFGITYAGEIRASGSTSHELASAAGISPNLGTEINKGIRLARYVAVR
jgi:5-methylcytosine-specific restriction protein B